MKYQIIFLSLKMSTNRIKPLPPKSAFSFFSQKYKDNAIIQNMSLPMYNIILKDIWINLSEQERNKYNELFELDFLRYKKEMEEYLKPEFPYMELKSDRIIIHGNIEPYREILEEMGGLWIMNRFEFQMDVYNKLSTWLISLKENIMDNKEEDLKDIEYRIDTLEIVFTKLYRDVMYILLMVCVLFFTIIVIHGNLLTF